MASTATSTTVMGGEKKPLILRYAGPSSGVASAAPNATGLTGTGSAKAGNGGNDAEAEKKSLRQVRSLFLTCQNIVSMTHIQHLDEMTGLRSLSLHMNLVRRIEGLDNLRQLVELDLSGNEIRALTPGCFRAQAHLARLNLSSNYLVSLPPGAFAFLPSLSWLSLAYNGLTSVTEGLASIPRAAPLAYVDLCGNNIAHLAEVTDGLVLHKDHVKELRLQTPQQLLSGIIMGSTDGGQQQQQQLPSLGPLCALSPLAAPALRENPLCQETFPREDSGGPRMSYAEAALLFFPKLVVLNGVTFGVDPAKAILEHHQEAGKRRAEERAEMAAEEEMLKGRMAQTAHTLPLHAEHFFQQQQQHSPLRSARKLTFPSGECGLSPLGAPVPPAEDISRSVHFVTPDRDEDDDDSNDDEGGNSRLGRQQQHRTRRRSRSTSRHRPTPKARQSESHKDGDSMRSKEEHTPASPSAGSTGATTTTAAGAASSLSPGGYKLQWRPKRVSRGTSTADIDDITSGSARTDRREKQQREPDEDTDRLRLLQQQLQKAHEQLQLRTAMEADLRRHLADHAQRVKDLEEQKSNQRRQLEERVAALKDELVRRSSEVSIMKRKERANLDEQASAMEAHWQEVLAKQTGQWQRTLTSKEEVLAAMQDRMTKMAAQKDLLEKQLHEWKDGYQDVRHRCEEAVTQLHASKRQHATTMSRQQALHDAMVGLLEEEGRARRTLEAEGAHESNVLLSALLTHSLEESAARLEEWTQYKETWEDYAQSLQRHYKEVLQHAQREAAALREQVDQLKAVAHTQQSPSAAATTATAEEKEEKQQMVAVDAACDPIPQPEDKGQSVARVVPPLSAIGTIHTAAQGNHEDDPLSAATTYWRDVATQQKDELSRLHVALQLSESTNTAMASENKRLLAQLDGIKDSRDKEWEAEKENLLRSLHNLQQDLGKKDAALDALEEEARHKIDEKRRTIAELQERLENLEEANTRSTESAVKCRDELFATQERLKRAEEEERRLRECGAAQEKQLDTLKLELAAAARQQQHEVVAAVPERRQYELEQARLVAALTVAREQLVRLHQSHTSLTSENSSLTSTLACRERELQEARQQLKDLHENGKQKQRATLEALTRMMALSE